MTTTQHHGAGSLPKLFWAYSVLRDFKYDGAVYPEVPIRWFVRSRKGDLGAPYDQLITGLAEECELIQGEAKQCADEFFTETELQRFTEYVDVEVGAKEAELPFPCDPGDGTVWMPDGFTPVRDGFDFYLISERTDYPFPFDVEGRFQFEGLAHAIDPMADTVSRADARLFYRARHNYSPFATALAEELLNL